MSRYRILVVDDEADVRSIIVATLRPHYEVVEAHDGLDALEKLARAEPDFVLMDVMMPLMDGFQACESIRKHPRFNALPVMFLSALGTKDDMRKGYSSGANLYLTKPFEPSRLLRNIQVFFETTPPPLRPKRYPIEQLLAFERAAAGTRPSTIHEAETAFDYFAGSPPDPTPPPAGSSPPPPKAPAPAKAPEAPRDALDEADTLPPPSIPDAAPPPPPVAPRKPRVLIVDDDEEVIKLMAMVLENQFDVVSATDGLQAIERLVRYQPDLIVLDVMLPKMSGFQLCQSLRANKSFSQTPILVCSARHSQRDVAYARRVGANECLAKPFENQQLLDTLNAMTRAPGFTVHDKALDYEQVRTELMPRQPTTDAFNIDSEVRRVRDPEEPAAEEPDTREAVKSFLRKEGTKEAFEKESEETQKKESKKKKFFFGFGAKE